MTVDQHEARSADGTMIPYFVVHKADMPLDGSNPTLLYGYGGFSSLLPGYSATVGKLWLERGGVYVIANTRGGGEFGPRWHEAALQQNRQRAHEDFQAVALDLIARDITSQPKLGIMGGSQGGLFMGAMLTQRPDLINAAVIQVPLFDMLRFHKLLAGDSWKGEYGDPDIPEQRAWIQAYSPYQNLRAASPIPKSSSTPRPRTTGSIQATPARRRRVWKSWAIRCCSMRTPTAAMRRGRTCKRRRGGWRWNTPICRGG